VNLSCSVASTPWSQPSKEVVKTKAVMFPGECGLEEKLQKGCGLVGAFGNKGLMSSSTS
jgi:hypothetical protein